MTSLDWGERIAVVGASALFFALLSPWLGALPWWFMGSPLALGRFFGFFLLAGTLNGVVLLPVALSSKFTNGRLTHAIVGAIVGWMTTLVWPFVVGDYDVSFSNQARQLLQYRLISMFEWAVLMPVTAGAICAAIFNPLAARRLRREVKEPVPAEPRPRRPPVFGILGLVLPVATPVAGFIVLFVLLLLGGSTKQLGSAAPVFAVIAVYLLGLGSILGTIAATIAYFRKE